MNIDVYDTYVRTSEGDLLHFDVLLPSGKGDMATNMPRNGYKALAGTPKK